MSQSAQDIWRALAKDGPIPIEGLEEAVGALLTEHPKLAVNPDVKTSLLYSGGIHKVGAYDVSTYADQGQGSYLEECYDCRK